MKTTYYILCFVFAAACFYAYAASEKINYSYIIIRHGMRSPSRYFNNTPMWKEGKGGLTERGAYELYEISSRLRERYSEKGLLTDRHKSLEELPHLGDISVKSSNASRIIDSAYYFMLGLIGDEYVNYTSSDHQSAIDRIRLLENYGFKQFPQDVDLFNKPFRTTNCPSMPKYMKEYFDAKGGMQKAIEDRVPNATLTYLEVILDKKRDKMTPADLFYVADFLQCYALEGRLDEIQPNFSMNLTTLIKDLDFAINYAFFEGEFGDDISLKMRSHFNLFLVIDKILFRESRKEKIFFHSSHEGVIFGLLRLFTDYKHLKGPSAAPFASHFAFEIFEKARDKTEYVRIYFNNKVIPQPYCRDPKACQKEEIIKYMTKFMFKSDADFYEKCEGERLKNIYEEQQSLVEIGKSANEIYNERHKSFLSTEKASQSPIAAYSSIACFNSADLYDMKLEITDFLNTYTTFVFNETYTLDTLGCTALRRYFLDNKELFMKKIKALHMAEQKVQQEIDLYRSKG